MSGREVSKLLEAAGVIACLAESCPAGEGKLCQPRFRYVLAASILGYTPVSFSISSPKPELEAVYAHCSMSCSASAVDFHTGFKARCERTVAAPESQTSL